MLMYEAKVKVEREIWVQNIDFLRFWITFTI